MSYKLLVYGWTGRSDSHLDAPYTAVHEFHSQAAAKEALDFFSRGNLIIELIDDPRPSSGAVS